MSNAFDQSARVHRIFRSLRGKLAKRDKRSPLSYHVCNFCGFIMENQAPDECPICTAPAARFDTIHL